MPENKTQQTKASVATFVEAIPDDAKRADAKSLLKLMQAATGEKPQMWGPAIIGFGSRHYKYESGREGDMPMVAFSPRKAAIVLYSLLAPADSAAQLAKLGQHTTGKGCLYIKKLSDIDQAVLKTMVAESFKAMRAEHKR